MTPLDFFGGGGSGQVSIKSTLAGQLWEAWVKEKCEDSLQITSTDSAALQPDEVESVARMCVRCDSARSDYFEVLILQGKAIVDKVGCPNDLMPFGLISLAAPLSRSGGGVFAIHAKRSLTALPEGVCNDGCSIATVNHRDGGTRE